MLWSQNLTEWHNEHSSWLILKKELAFSLLFTFIPRGYLNVLREFQILPRSSERSAE